MVKPSTIAMSLGTLLAAALLLVPATTVRSAGPVLNPANGPWYETVPGAISWMNAHTASQKKAYQGLPGHLATITSAAESQFVVSQFPELANPALCLGGFQPDGNVEPSGGWQWVTGEVWSFTNWNSGEPNNVGGNESCLVSATGGRWNDGISTDLFAGYLVEYESPSATPPGTPANLSLTQLQRTSVSLTWVDLSSNETGFEVERRAEGGNYALIATTPANTTTYVDSGLQANVTYTYRVRAVNGSGASGYTGFAASKSHVDITFAAPLTYTLSAPTTELVAADFDGDGIMDIAVGAAPNLSVLFGQGDGTLSAPVNIPVADHVGNLVAADINGDGRPDIVVCDEHLGLIYVIRNLGQREFQFTGSYAVGSIPYGIVAADFNGDGRLDIAVSNDGSNNMCVLLNTGSGFAPAVFYQGGSNPSRLAVGDFVTD